MVFPVVGGNKSKGYDVENSLRFDASDSPQLSKDMSSLSATSTKKFTTSFWLKPGNVPQTSYGGIIDVGGDHAISLVSDNTFYFFENGGSDLYWRPTRVFRDPSAWYNIIIIADSTLSTQTDRVKIYVNGVIETSFHNNSGPNQNHDFAFNTNNTRYIGRKQTTSSSLDGYLTEIHHIDGQAKAHTDFGKFNDNGVWVPIKYTGTYGNTGYYLEFKQTGTSQNSSGIGADTSGNDNHFAVSNLAATDITEDTCTNNFATFNPLYVDLFNQERTLSEGNTEVDFAGNSARGAVSLTQAVNNGKWYFEIKVVDNSGFYPIVGSINENASQTAPYGRRSTGTAIAYDTDGTLKYENSNTSYGSALSNGDILQIALDMDNHLLWFGINGTWQNSATQTEIENSTATNDATTKVGEQTFLTNFDDITIFMQDVNSSGNAHAQLNTGNPAFSISSGNTDGKYGNFEYSVPSGYYALCTKRLAEFG